MREPDCCVLTQVAVARRVKTAPKSGETVVKTLSTRTHKCPHCDYVADRDENAANNILKSALKQWATTVGRTECEVSGEILPCSDLETNSRHENSKKEKT